MEIRCAREDEAVALSVIAFISKSYWPYAAAQLDAWRGDLTITPEQIAAHPTFVAMLDDSVAGFYQILAGQDAWVLEHLWVLPVQMGKGVGRALLEHAMDLAQGDGAREISIDADPHAESFYFARGARTVSVVAAPIFGEPQRVRPQMIMQFRK